jgi:hypothetical protein
LLPKAGSTAAYPLGLVGVNDGDLGLAELEEGVLETK